MLVLAVMVAIDYHMFGHIAISKVEEVLHCLDSHAPNLVEYQ